jgi:hypothetical protein
MKIGILAIAATLLASSSAALAVEPDEANGAQGVVLTSFSIGLFDPNGKVPVLDGVPGAGVHNWDIPTPKALLLNGTSYIYQITFQSLTYSGSCKATYKLTQKQGKKNVVLDSGVLAPTFDCTSPSNWVYAVPGSKPLAGVTGAATLTGTLTLDGGKITVQTPVTIQ